MKRTQQINEVILCQEGEVVETDKWKRKGLKVEGTLNSEGEESETREKERGGRRSEVREE